MTTYVVLGFVLSLTTVTSAQQVDLETCLGPDCWVLGVQRIMVQPCHREFSTYFGRAAWYPLRCVGPITIALETYARFDTRFPLYLEIVPAEDFWTPCADIPGRVVMITYGQLDEHCGAWDEVGPIDITNIVPVGESYVVRIYGFSNIAGSSPAIGCIRVTSHPSAVETIQWGTVKFLYK